MADKKITALTALTATGKDSAADLLHIIDYSASPVNKKISVANLFSNVNTDTHIYGSSKVFEVGQAAAVNSHLRVAIGADASTDGAVTINDDGVAYVDFLVKSLNSDGAIKVDAGTDDISINSDGNAAADFHVHGGTKELITTDGGEDWVGIGTATPVTAYTLSVGATSGKSIEAQGTIDITGALTVSTTSTLTGNTTIGAVGAGVLITPSVESVTTDGAGDDLSPTITCSLVTTNAASGAGALANGTVGQIKYITLVALGTAGTDEYLLTPATRNGFATIKFDSIWDSITLIYQTAGWTVVSTGGSVVVA